MVTEKDRLKTLASNPTQVKAIMRRLEMKSESTATKLNTKANKKISFHLQVLDMSDFEADIGTHLRSQPSFFR